MMQESNNEGKYTLEYLERQVHNLTQLVEINNIINSTLDIAKLLTIIMEIIKDIMNAEASTLFLYEEEKKELVFKVALGEAGKDLQEKYRIKLGEGVAGWVAQNRKTIIVNEVYDDPRFDSNYDKITGFTTKAILCSPLLFKGKLIGAIQAINPLNKPRFDEEDQILFQAFADQCALAVQNAIFFQSALEEERIKNELKSATVIQQSLLPETDRQYSNIIIAAKSLSALEVGGEFFSIFEFGENAVGIALGDMQKRGIPGSIYASIATGAVKGLARLLGGNPASILRKVHEVLKEHFTAGSAFSLFYGLADYNEKTVQFANTGVGYPILIRENKARYLRFGGDFENRDPKNIKVKLQSGDAFVIITDGIINLKNRGGKLLGLKRVMQQLENRYESPKQIIESLIELMNEFTQGLELREDVSFIALMAQ